MRKVLLLALACFVVFPTFAIVMIPHGNPAIRQLQMNRAKQREGERREHIENYHHGALAYDAEFYDITERINKKLCVVTYEERRYFYVLEEIDKCTVKTEVHKIASRRAAEKEIEAYGKQIRNDSGRLFAYGRRNERKDNDNARNCGRYGRVL